MKLHSRALICLLAATCALSAGAFAESPQFECNGENISAHSVLHQAMKLEKGREHGHADYLKQFDQSVHTIAIWDRAQDNPISQSEKVDLLAALDKAIDVAGSKHQTAAQREFFSLYADEARAQLVYLRQEVRNLPAQ